MKENLKYNLVFLLAMALVLPSFVDASGSADTGSLLQAQQYSQQPAQAALVKVVASPMVPQVSIKSGSALVTAGNECVSAGLTSRNFVQDTGLIDLNQPSGCFSLEVGKAVMVGNLQVKPLAAAAPEVKVLVLRSTISSGSLAPAPFRPADPMVPVSVAGLAIVFYLLFRKGTAVSARMVRTGHYHVLTLHQLQMLRC